MRGSLQALNAISNRVTFTAVVPGVSSWEASDGQISNQISL